MAEAPLRPHQATARELTHRLEVERRGVPFIVFRDGQGAQRILELTTQLTHVSLGRSAECDVALVWDGQASRLHAELERIGSHWLLIDDGMSSNGTFVGGERVSGRRRLKDADVVQVGATALVFRHPGTGAGETTRMSDERDIAARVTKAQRRVLIALCRPFKYQANAATPATNPQIAAELHLTVAAVKTHLRALFHAFEIEDLPQHDKRRRLVALAFAAGVVSDRDL